MEMSEAGAASQPPQAQRKEFEEQMLGESNLFFALNPA